MKIERNQAGINHVVGVKCDICGHEHDLCAAPDGGTFLYYSLDARKVDVVNGIQPTSVNKLPVVSSIDACNTCITTMADTVKANYTPTRDGINCDLCPERMRGTYTYYYVNVARVDVSMAAGTKKCLSCGVVLRDNIACCASPRPALIARVASDEILQIVMCERDHNAMFPING